MEIDILRAVKIWWSFMWRAWLLMFPAFLVYIFFVVFLAPIPFPGQEPKAFPPEESAKIMIKMIFAWIFLMGSMVLAQAFAIKWMLRTQWSDFKLVAVAIEPDKSKVLI